MPTVTLQLRVSGRLIQEIAVGERPIRLGRASSNDVVVTDERVSNHHLVVWAGEGLWVEDLRSRNGTRLDGEPIAGVAPLVHGAVLEFGSAMSLTVDAPGGLPAGGWPGLYVELLGTPLRMPVLGARFRIGSGHADDLRLPGTEPAEAAILVCDGQLWLGRGVEEAPLALGAEVAIGGQRVRVVRGAPDGRTPTRTGELPTHPYRLTVATRGPRSPRVVLEDPGSDRRWEVERDNRAILLFLLARKWSDDLARGVAADRAGWMDDEEVARGVWGRGRASEANGLNVLVYRIRREARGAGLDPWFLEKHNGRLRLLVDRVELDETEPA